MKFDYSKFTKEDFEKMKNKAIEDLYYNDGCFYGDKHCGSIKIFKDYKQLTARISLWEFDRDAFDTPPICIDTYELDEYGDIKYDIATCWDIPLAITYEEFKEIFEDVIVDYL